MANKIKRPTGIAPKGPFKFPKLSEPDFGTKEFPKPQGEFSTKLVLKEDAAETKAWLAQLQPLHDRAVENAKKAIKDMKVDARKKLEKKNGGNGLQINDLFTQVYDKETEEPTGEIEVKFAMTYSGEYKSGPKTGKKWFRRPDIFDAKGKKMVKAPDIWGGTVGRVAYEIGVDRESGEPGYFIPGTGAVGLKLGLQAARILELVSGGQRSASDYGFDSEEEGYEYVEQIDDPSDDTEKTGDKPAGGEADENTDF